MITKVDLEHKRDRIIVLVEGKKDKEFPIQNETEAINYAIDLAYRLSVVMG